MQNPLAIGVTLGGRFLDLIVPRPKPRAVYTHEFSLLSQRFVTRTGQTGTSNEDAWVAPSRVIVGPGVGVR